MVIYQSGNKRLPSYGILDPIVYKEKQSNIFRYDYPSMNGYREVNKMSEEKGTVPDYKGDGIAVWIKQKKDGEKYLSICLLGGLNLPAWKYTPKPKEEPINKEL